MRKPRFGIRTMMVGVATVAVSITALRILPTYPYPVIEFLVRFGLIIPALIFGIGRWEFGRRDYRPFWAGFSASGLYAAMSLWVHTSGPPSRGVFKSWETYLGWSERFVATFSGFGAFIRENRSPRFVVIVLLFAIPQVSMAFAGGTLAHFVMRLLAWWHVRRLGRGPEGRPTVPDT